METWCEGVYFEPGPNKPNLAGIILSCGIHGDETGPIHLLQRLHNELQLAALAPSRPLLLIFGNPDAIRHQQRYVDSNLNRLFTRPPSPQPVAGESREAARARQLMQVCQRFQQQVPQVDLHLDLHSTIKRSCIERFALTPVHSGHYSDRWLGQLWQAGFGGLVHQTGVRIKIWTVVDAKEFVLFEITKSNYKKFGELTYKKPAGIAEVTKGEKRILLDADIQLDSNRTVE